MVSRGCVWPSYYLSDPPNLTIPTKNLPVVYNKVRCLSFAREARVAPERGPLPALACWRITKSIGYSWLYSSVLHKQTATPVLRAADSLSALASLKSEVADSLCSSATSRHGVAGVAGRSRGGQALSRRAVLASRAAQRDRAGEQGRTAVHAAFAGPLRLCKRRRDRRRIPDGCF